MNEIFNSITETTATTTNVTINALLISIGTACLLGLFISLAYTKTQRKIPESKGFALTLVILPTVITVIIMLIGGNIASAFSLAGAFSIIRFRSEAGSPKDITYVLFAMAIGLACGLGYVMYGIITALILCAIIVVLELTKFGEQNSTAELLKITIPENLDYKNVFDDVMKKYTQSFNLLKVKTTELGSLYELEYLINTKNDINEKDFIDELRCRNGNMTITLVLKPEDRIY